MALTDEFTTAVDLRRDADLTVRSVEASRRCLHRSQGSRCTELGWVEIADNPYCYEHASIRHTAHIYKALAAWEITLAPQRPGKWGS